MTDHITIYFDSFQTFDVSHFVLTIAPINVNMSHV